MPFHEYAYYPGGMEALKKSYQPEFPPAAEFRMGGTGLSGLALGEGAFRKLTPALKDDGLCMFVANPITSKVQTIAMHRDGPYWKLEQAVDLITCDDPFFRPVGMTNGPDGCIYIVDWYNKIISHNEVARTHPDRDKTRGRIWRVKAKGAPRIEVPDFTKLSGDELIAKLGAEPLAQSHLAWQAIADRGLETPAPKLREIVRSNAPVAKRVAAIWALNGLFALENEDVIESVRSPDAHLRREAVCASVSTPEALRKLAGGETTGSTGTIAMRPGRGAGVGPRDSGAPSGARSDLGGSPVVSPPANFRQPSGLLAALVADPNPRVRAEVIRLVGSDATLKLALTVASGDFPPKVLRAIDEMLRFAREPLAEPTAPSSRNGKPIKVREAYDREFERYLVRMFLEQHPDAVAKFLDSEAARELPIEARLLASLALEPRASAARVAKLLPQLQRAPGQEEVLRLAQFPDEPGVGDSLREVLSNPVTRSTALEALLATRTRLDATKLTPFLTDAAKQLLAANDDSSVQLGIQLAGAFQLARTEDALVALAEDGLPAGHGRPASRLSAPAGGTPAGRDRRDVCLPALRALSQIGSARSELFASLAKSAPDQSLRAEAVLALAASKAPDAAERLLKLWPDLQPTQRHASLERLASSKSGAKGLIGAIRGGSVKKDELDGPTVEKLQAVLGDDPELAALLGELASNFRPVLALDGSDEAYVETTLSFDGPLTVETWVRLAPGLGNMDGILGVPGQLDVNFFGGKFRVYAGGTVHDAVVATKAMTPEMWTHVAAVRDAEGHWQLYLDGQLDPAPSKPAPGRLENVRIAWTGAKAGTQGALAEYRLWNRARAGEEISRDFDRSIVQAPGLVFSSAATPWGKLHAGAKVTKTSDFPPILTADEATALDAKFAKYRALAAQPGDATRGKTTAMLCSACHLFKGQGGNIGPDLSGVGAMGVEAILRNILTPNAAMENGYRIYRVELKGGDLVDAFFVSEDKEAVVIRQPGTPDRRIARGDIRSTKFLRRSLMPEGLLDVLPTEQASDLLAYLLSLK